MAKQANKNPKNISGSHDGSGHLLTHPSQHVRPLTKVLLHDMQTSLLINSSLLASLQSFLWHCFQKDGRWNLTPAWGLNTAYQACSNEGLENRSEERNWHLLLPVWALLEPQVGCPKMYCNSITVVFPLKNFFLMWAIFKQIHYWMCYNVASVFMFYFLGFLTMRHMDSSSPRRDWTWIPCIGKWSLNHWTTREVPVILN